MGCHKGKRFFVTGTDTDVGKTYVSRLLADGLGEKGRVGYVKPVQTGCQADALGQKLAPDFDYVRQGAAGLLCSYEQHVPYRFMPAVSPHFAAHCAGEVISFSRIAQSIQAVGDCCEYLIVEGAGGVLCPLGETVFMVDLIKYLDLPVVVVCAARLGTLNHTFLTLRALHEAQITVAGVVMNDCGEPLEALARQENVRMVREHGGPTPFLALSFGATLDKSVREFCDALT